MLHNKDRVVVEDGFCTQRTVPTKQVHHRNFPEIRAECGSVAEGTVHLVSQLSLYREGAQNAWHCELIDGAIADVAEFLAALDATGQAAETDCGCGGP